MHTILLNLILYSTRLHYYNTVTLLYYTLITDQITYDYIIFIINSII